MVAVSGLDALPDWVFGIGVGQNHHFGETEAVIREAGSPSLVLVLMTAGDVIIGDLGIAQVLDIEARSVGEAIAWTIAVPRFLFGPRCTDGCFEFFGKAQTQGVALIEAH